MTSTRPIRAYADTSVFGGCFEERFQDASKRFFEGVNAGRFIVLLGATTEAELALAPDRVQEIVASLSDDRIIRCPITPDVAELRQAYLDAGVLGTGSFDDATHVAIATAHSADLLISWNFRHIVNYDKIRGFNAVNLRLNYRSLSIHSPPEIVYGKDEERL